MTTHDNGREPAAKSGVMRILAHPALPWAIIAAGILLRLRLYLANFSLWLDEAMLAVSVRDTEFAGLFAPLIEYSQTAPIGFLLVVKSLSLLFGNGEPVLRLLPLLAGIGALVLFHPVAKRLLPLPLSLVALALFAGNEHLLRYSAEFKQYSCDVFFAVLLLLLALRALDRNLCRTSLVVLGAAGIVAVYFSFAALFVLAGFGLTFAMLLLGRKEWERFGFLAVIGILWIGAFGLQYTLITGDNIRVEGVTRYFSQQRAFMPLPPDSVDDVLWFPKAGARLLKHPGGFQIESLAALLLVLGAVSRARRGPWILALLLAPVLLVLVASGFQKYPFYERLILFTVPALAVLIGEGLLWVDGLRKRLALARWAAAVLALVVLAEPAYDGLRALLRGHGEEEIRPLVVMAQRQRAEGDPLAAVGWSIPAARYYVERLGIPDSELLRENNGVWPGEDQDIRPLLDGATRVYVLYNYRDEGLEQGYEFDPFEAWGRLERDEHTPGAGLRVYRKKKSE